MESMESMESIESELQYESPSDPGVVVRHRRLADLLGTTAGELPGVVADLGCGDGVTLEVLLERVGAGAVVGVDAAEPALVEAERRLGRGSGDRLTLVAADLTAPLPLRDGSLDAALCHNVLESLPDPDGFLAEVHRVLRPGGSLVLSHPDYDTMVFTAPDLALTRRLVHAYCDTQQDWMGSVNGTIGRWLHDIAGRSPLEVELVCASTVLSQGFRAPMLGYEFAHHVADVLRRTGEFADGVLDGWLDSLAEVDRRGAFLWSINDYAVRCRKPAAAIASGSAAARVASATVRGPAGQLVADLLAELDEAERAGEAAGGGQLGACAPLGDQPCRQRVADHGGGDRGAEAAAAPVGPREHADVGERAGPDLRARGRNHGIPLADHPDPVGPGRQGALGGVGRVAVPAEHVQLGRPRLGGPWLGGHGGRRDLA
jgi:SAM-dependent methyltransferase